MRNTLNLAVVLLLGNCCLVLSQNGYSGVTIDLDGTLNCPADANRRLGACSLDLVGVQPVGVKLGAVCFEESKTSGDAVCVYDGKEFDTRPFPSGATETPTRVRETESTDTSVPTIAADDVASYIMEGIRHHGTN
ncbi:uncharacterized protein DFL_006547 [Arthrobotrys flagrans]|uniref:Secreted protein n=1 Tax=Arthrobotrys flagrans TaxID=97331 RepID=A0A436ZTQ0_ARTFL|nr:hypothetical protein DFL_006547 [Arthrobotrys flagrans]